MNQDGLYQSIDYDEDTSSDISSSSSVLLSDSDSTTPPRCSSTGSEIPSLSDEDDDQLTSPVSSLQEDESVSTEPFVRQVQMSPIENSYDYDEDTSSDISSSSSVPLSDSDSTTPHRCSSTGSEIPSLSDEDDDQLTSPVSSLQEDESVSTEPFVRQVQMSPIENSYAEVFSERTTLTVERLAMLNVEDDVTPGTVSDHWSVTSWGRSENLESDVEEVQETGGTDLSSSDDSPVGGDGRFGNGGYQPPLGDAVRAANVAWEIYQVTPGHRISNQTTPQPLSPRAPVSPLSVTQGQHSFTQGHVEWCVEMDQDTGRAGTSSSDDSSEGGDGRRATAEDFEDYLNSLFQLESRSESTPNDVDDVLLLAAPDSTLLPMEDIQYPGPEFLEGPPLPAVLDEGRAILYGSLLPSSDTDQHDAEQQDTVRSLPMQAPGRDRSEPWRPVPNVTLPVTQGGEILNTTTPRTVSPRAQVSPFFVAQGLHTSTRLLRSTLGRTISPTALGRQPGTATSEAENTEWGLEDFREFPGAEEALSEDLWVVAPPAWQVDTPDRRLPPTLVQFVLQHERTRVRFLRREWGHRFRITISGQRAVTISKCYEKE
ncbi:uncharacterized protein LOC127012490 [Drosophila biarmipes]|uniref:uncharacterized protein LOC127012490 n=1 Tax=Drosophila biarmipes TaxID=125945 RepID=UPI0021CD0C6A|nr:uncharacterized protein LOC127012490 [Drosophila biarmipes]